jgi:hypothetical protein
LWTCLPFNSRNSLCRSRNSRTTSPCSGAHDQRVRLFRHQRTAHAGAAGRIPPPLEDSPKCPRCSLVGICLPDEVNFLRQGKTTLRPIAVVREESVPLCVQANKASVRKKGDNLEVAVEDQVVARPRLMDVSQAVLMGNVYMTTPTLHELLRRGITVGRNWVVRGSTITVSAPPGASGGGVGRSASSRCLKASACCALLEATCPP